MEVRLARKKDVDEIVELWKYMMDFHGEIHPYFKTGPKGDKNFRGFLKRQIGSSGSLVLVAEDQGRIIGFCLGLIMEYPPVFIHRKKGHINDMVVAEDYQKKEVGKELLLSALNWFKQVGIAHVELDVAKGNQIADAFYRKNGFEVIMQRMLRKL